MPKKLNGTHQHIDLTKDQLKAARALLATRPLCLPGTRAIIEEAKAKAWHSQVSDKILELKLAPKQVVDFCDAAGVAE